MADTQKPVPAIPDYLKKFMTPAGAAPGPSDADSMITAGSVPRISLKAKKFRYIEEGEEQNVETETFFVILGVDPPAGKTSKTFYLGAYNPSDTAPPDCASSDGIRPDPWVNHPQNDLCSTCPKNVFGSATSRSGGKAKACRDSKRLWVVRPDALEGTVYGLQVPVTSLKNLGDLGAKLRDAGAPMSAAVIKATMDDDESYPILHFEIAGWLDEKFFPIAQERNSKKNWEGALKAPNPPVAPAMLAANGNRGNGSAPPAVSNQPKVNEDGSIQGTATKSAPNVDETLRTWG